MAQSVITREKNGTALFAVLFSFLLLFASPSYAGGQVVIVNNAALKTAQGMNIQVYRLNGKGQSLVKNQMIVASTDCVNGCGQESMSIDIAPGDYKIQVFGGVALDITSVSFPVKAGDEFVWMVSNSTTTPHIRAMAPGVKVLEQKSPFRIDISTYSKGEGVPAAAANTPRKKEKNAFWPFRPNNSQRSAPNK
jgi:hypothetical protein